MLCSSDGKAIRFLEEDVRPMGRTAGGVRGIRLAEGAEVISLIIANEPGMILIASENGFGKLTPVEEFPAHGRGGQGVIALQTTERNGRVVGALQVSQEDQMMLISSTGTLVRTPVSEVSVQGRNTQGVRLIRLDDGARLVGLERVESENGEESEGEGEEGPAPVEE
jgi:DNA gyrase subunit A